MVVGGKWVDFRVFILFFGRKWWWIYGWLDGFEVEWWKMEENLVNFELVILLLLLFVSLSVS